MTFTIPGSSGDVLRYTICETKKEGGKLSKEYTKEEVILNKKEAIKSLNKMLEGFINDPTGNYLKKANLLSYWIKDYVRLINFEEKFEPTRNIAYKRGNIVKIQFGFNIGSEYGGLHYGVVLDNKNAHNSPVVTVIPLTSARENRAPHSNSVNLGNDIYRLLKLKYDTIDRALKEEQRDIDETLSLFNAMLAPTQKSINELEECDRNSNNFTQKLIVAKGQLETLKKLQTTWREKSLHNKEQQEYLEKIGLEISRMKEGSIALVNQITTVSKMRIFDPRNLKGVLAGISLSEENMKKINQKVKDLYVFL